MSICFSTANFHGEHHKLYSLQAGLATDYPAAPAFAGPRPCMQPNMLCSPRGSGGAISRPGGGCGCWLIGGGGSPTTCSKEIPACLGVGSGGESARRVHARVAPACSAPRPTSLKRGEFCLAWHGALLAGIHRMAQKLLCAFAQAQVRATAATAQQSHPCEWGGCCGCCPEHAWRARSAAPFGQALLLAATTARHPTNPHPCPPCPPAQLPFQGSASDGTHTHTRTLPGGGLHPAPACPWAERPQCAMD